MYSHETLDVIDVIIPPNSTTGWTDDTPYVLKINTGDEDNIRTAPSLTILSISSLTKTSKSSGIFSSALGSVEGLVVLLLADADIGPKGGRKETTAMKCLTSGLVS